MQTLPRNSGTLNAYEFYIATMLKWRCQECDLQVDVVLDIRDDELKAAPWGAWATRQAGLAMRNGWYVPPLTTEGSLTPSCLCPACAKRLGHIVTE